MPGGAICEHSRRKRDCRDCCVDLCEHGNVPRRCWFCNRKAPARPRSSPAGSVWVPGLGHLSTPALVEAGTRGVVLAPAVQLDRLRPSVRAVNATPLTRTQLVPCDMCLAFDATALDQRHAFSEVVTQADEANLLGCVVCNRYVLPTSVRSCIMLWRARSNPATVPPCASLVDASWSARPCELALWKTRPLETLGRMLSAYENTHGGLRVECSDCHHVYWADHVLGMALRLDRAASRGDPCAMLYAGTSSLRELVDDVKPRIEAALAVSPGSVCTAFTWSRCVRCCTTASWAERSMQAMREAHAAAASLGWTSLDSTAVACPLGVALDLSSVQMPSFASQTDSFQIPVGDRLRVAVLMLVREQVAPLIQVPDAKLRPLKGAPGLPTLHSQLVGFGSASDCAAAAGGVEVDFGLVVIVPQRDVAHCLQTAPGERASAFCEMVQGGGCEVLGICAGFGLEGEHDAFLAAIEEEESAFLRQMTPRSVASCPAAAEDPTTSNAGGRCGWFTTPSALLGQPDFRQYASDHTMAILHPQSMCSALLLYPCGPQGRPAPFLPASAQRYDSAPKCHGQPRYHRIYPGRKCISLGSVQARVLFEQGGATYEHNTRKARAALRSLLILKHFGLHTCSGELLGRQVADTMQYTTEMFAQHPSVASAVNALSMVKGFYVNFFPAAFHLDADKYMESWSVRQSTAGRREAGGRLPAPTLLPQVGVALTADPNLTVWTANLASVMHAAQDMGGSFGEPRLRGANDAFHLQSRGAHSMRVPN